ncbi:hypothetical protein LG634_23065 [Streptomyces bambusae]|uniref:HAAS signaling domain-containing protein n=1 Tax=Streptomyces bambusae TaxID=1550616 RepID=UPI001CFD8E77|nr:hypothetical protein [Streptomyces bambusae]MCB5167699.1 hypothetical protein [Streptomyces bambusae]
MHTEHPLVHDYLAAVERESSALPAERRSELIADLREHIGATTGDDETRIREVLEQLGDPRTVAASAFAEEPVPAAPAAAAPRPVDSRNRILLTVALLGCGGLLGLAHPLAGAAALLTGLVLLAGSRGWSPRRKAAAAATTAGGPLLVGLAAFLFAASGIGPMELLLLIAVCGIVPAAGALTLWRAART